MGTKGAKLTGVARQRAEELVETLSGIKDVSHRAMFGGVGLFTAGSMFAIVDSSGGFFLKADDETRERFEAAGSTRHGRMPYWSVPAAVEKDPDRLREWAERAASLARG